LVFGCVLGNFSGKMGFDSSGNEDFYEESDIFLESKRVKKYLFR